MLVLIYLIIFCQPRNSYLTLNFKLCMILVVSENYFEKLINVLYNLKNTFRFTFYKCNTHYISLKLDTMVCAGCCAALDHFVTYIFKKVSRSGRKRRASGADQHEEETCLMVLKQHPEILQQV